MKKIITSTSAIQTKHIAEGIGRNLKGGEVIELASDLGGGKTTFVQGLAKGIGSSDHVASPTFTISRVYKSKELEMHHLDFYRLHDAGLMTYELSDVLNDPKVVLVVEWGDVVAHVLPEARLIVHVIRTGDETRRFEFEYPPALAHVLENIT